MDLVANFRYEVDTNKDPMSLKTGDYDDFDSICGRTMVGLVKHRANKEFSCMVGEKKDAPMMSNVVDDR
jgi:hypothetical protein